MGLEHKWQVFSLVALSIFMSTLDSSIVNVALPYMMKDLGVDMVSIQWVVVIYLLTVSSLLLVFGRLSDIRGRALVYKSGFALFTLGSFFCALSPNVLGLILSRAVQGMGASMLMACSPALIVDAFEPESRGRALGLVGACVASGLTMGPLAGGALLAWFSWRSIFYVNLPVGLIALVYAGMVLGKKGEKRDEPLDILGGILMALMLGCFILALVKAPQWGLFSLKGLGCMTISLAAGAFWVRHSRKTPFPLFDIQLFHSPGFTLPLVSSLLLFAALFSLVFLMPFYLSLACEFPPSRTGMVMIAPFLFLLGVSPLAGILSDRLGTKPFCALGMLCMALSLFFLGRLLPGQSLWEVLWRLALAGMGTALFISPNSTAVMSAVSPGLRGIASGALATARNLGMVMGVCISSTVFSFNFSRLTHGVHLDNFTPALTPQFLTAFEYAMTAGSLMALSGFMVTMARKE